LPARFDPSMGFAGASGSDVVGAVFQALAEAAGDSSDPPPSEDVVPLEWPKSSDAMEERTP
jgi:hypothetical protein